LDQKPLQGLLIEGIVRTVGCAGYKSGGRRELSPGNLFHFVVCKLTSTHPAEYAVLVLVRHSFSFPVSFDFLLQNTGNPFVETKHGSKKRLQNKACWFNGAGSIWLFQNPETERGMAQSIPLAVTHLSPFELIRIEFFAEFEIGRTPLLPDHN
jgi:hypothetical protein